MQTERYDVVVIGGGTAGVIAAVQAGRAGAKTLLVEKYGQLGGTMIAGGVNFPGLFHARGRQVIAGIGWELITRCVAETGGTLPDFRELTGPFYSRQVMLDRAVYPSLCDEFVLDAGVELLLHTMIARVDEQADGVRVTLCTKTGLEELTTATLIDCTGDANAVSLAGYPLVTPETLQPATMVIHLSGYDPATLDFDALQQAAEAAVLAGELQLMDTGWNANTPEIGRMLRCAGENVNHVIGLKAADSRGKTQQEVEGRKSFMRLYRFLRAQQGLAGLRAEYLAPEVGVRETVTIVGETTVTVDDYTSARRWDDAVCNAYYPIDLHRYMDTIDFALLPEGVVPTIPRGALIPKGSRRLLVAGRCLASDRMANSGLRVQAACMAMGQAAGALAALAARTDIAVGAIPLDDLFALLRQHDAILPGESIY